MNVNTELKAIKQTKTKNVDIIKSNEHAMTPYLAHHPTARCNYAFSPLSSEIIFKAGGAIFHQSFLRVKGTELLSGKKESCPPCLFPNPWSFGLTPPTFAFARSVVPNLRVIRSGFDSSLAELDAAVPSCAKNV